MEIKLCKNMEIAYRRKRDKAAKIFTAKRDLDVSLESDHKLSRNVQFSVEKKLH